MKRPSIVVVAAAVLSLSSVACKKDEGPAGTQGARPGQGGDIPPPPPSAAAKPGACQNPGQIDDAISAPFFPKTIGTYCLDPAPGSVRTYGAQAKLSMDEVCTTAFDGECEVYKRYKLKRVVTLRYVDGGTGGGVVEVILSQFDSDAGAYGMFTKRVIADADPASDQAPKPVAAAGAAAIGGGRASSWRGAHLVELVYMNETEAPKKMVASSEAILPLLAKAINERLPGSLDKPAPVRGLPEANMVPLGVMYFATDLMGLKGVAPAALGYYKDGEKRYRFASATPADEAAAKEALKSVRSKPGALPVADVGDEAVHAILQDGKDGPKTEWLFARKGAKVLAVGDEELALKAGEALEAQKTNRLSKDEKITRLKGALK